MSAAVGPGAPADPPARDVLVVGASAGGVEALTTLVRDLPADLPAAVLVVLHVPQGSPGGLAAVLDRAGPLPAATARDGERPAPGTVRVAPPGHHLLLRDGTLRTSRGPRENGHRPAVDVLFRSAAADAGPRVVAVVLSGALDDGAAGLVAVRSRGGVAVVQSPDDALHPGMPSSAIEAAGADHVLPLADMAALLARVAGRRVPRTAGRDVPLLQREAAVADLDHPNAGDLALDPPGEPVGYSCPDCGGTLNRIEERGFERFRCRVGHAWSPVSLLARQDGAYEDALWVALRSLEEQAALSQALGERATTGGRRISAARFAGHSRQARHAAELLRELLDDPARPRDLGAEPGAPGAEPGEPAAGPGTAGVGG